MITLSEIDTTTKRATKAIGFSWGIAEEVGKNMKNMELFGLPAVKNLNEYFKNYTVKKFQKISLISEKNISQKIPYCPIISGVNFLDQINSLEKMKEIIFENMAYPIIFLPFASRASEIIGKRILLKVDDKEFLLSFNQTIYSNTHNQPIIENVKNLKINFLENNNSFSDKDWEEIYKLSEETFVEEKESLKKHGAGAGLTDND
tara:strand:+ start:471 stop:1082 length:612 start_codon:yes stop_codon:yes gene_type:complete